MQPLKFQEKAIDKLISSFKDLWKQNKKQLQIVFKSPTGSGKTYMTSSFIDEMTEQPDWSADVAYIWITFSDDLAMQSRDKFSQYFSQNLKNQLLTVADFNQGKLNKNDVLFLNWQKLVAKDAEKRLLRRPENPELEKEFGYYWEDVIEATQKDNREIIMIIDESHKNVTESAQKIVIDKANPRIIINVSATPKWIPDVQTIEDKKAAYVSVKHEDVINEGLIKEAIQCQASEDIRALGDTDLDETLITLAIKKREELKKRFESMGKTVNPLVLIQLPNDDKTLLDAGEKTKEQIVLDVLHTKGVDDTQIAMWFDGKKKNMEFISDNDCIVNFMLFKEAAGTGWDCPRAHILVMFREINSPTFRTQTIGRILRMPEPESKADYENYAELRKGYLFTNYEKNEVAAANWGDKNKPELFTAKPREDYLEYDFCDLLESDYLSRTDYGDIVDAKKFQESFIKSFDEYFNFDDHDFADACAEKVEAKNIEPNPELSYNMLADEELGNFDDIIEEIQHSSGSVLHKMSRNDIEKMFNFYCIKALLNQTEEEAKIGNASRSWKSLKSAIRVWFRKRLCWGGSETFVADMRKGDASVFGAAITKALKDYAPVRRRLLESKALERTHSTYKFHIQNEYSYTDDFEQIDSSKSLLKPCFIRKQYTGKENETKFLKFLDSLPSVDWWYKNGDKGQNNFGFQYINSETGKECLFYPDWIIRYIDGTIGIYDTKAGTTAAEAGDRAESLYKKLIELNKSLDTYNKKKNKKTGIMKDKIKSFTGGIVVFSGNNWYCNSAEHYSYDSNNLNKDWKLFNLAAYVMDEDLGIGLAAQKEF